MLMLLAVGLCITGSAARASDSLYEQFKSTNPKQSPAGNHSISQTDAISPTDQKPFAAHFKRRHNNRMMKRYDLNGDGKLDDGERAAMEKDRKLFRAKMLKKFDKNGDGKLDQTERLAIKEAMKSKRAERLKRFDKDGDGRLNEEERAAARAEWSQPHDKDMGRKGR